MQLAVPARAASLPLSLPAGPRAELRDAGGGWDAVRMQGRLGERVLAVLGDDCGAAIQDPYGHLLYIFIRPRAGDGWTFPEGAPLRVLGRGSAVVVPPADRNRSADVYWVRPVRNGRMLTRSLRLHAVMQDVIAQERRSGGGLW